MAVEGEGGGRRVESRQGRARDCGRRLTLAVAIMDRGQVVRDCLQAVRDKD